MNRDLHPIVTQLTPNLEQRPAIACRGCDVVVTAGAGTGKTRTLVARYLSLLANGTALRRIVAITFTRKAAREMRNRVRAEIQRYLAEGDLTSEERGRWLAVYAGLDAARIGTIHSLCGAVLRAHPAEADVDPRFQVLEEGEAALLRREALDAALAWAADEPQAVELFSLLGGADALRETLQTLLGQPMEASAAFADLGAQSDTLARWREVLRQRQARRLRQMLADPTWMEAVAALRRRQPTDPADRMAVQRRHALAAIGDALPTTSAAPASDETSSSDDDEVALEERLAALSRLDDINLVGGSYKAWPGEKADKAAVKDALGTLRELWRDHADLLSLDLTPLDEAMADALPGLQAIFQVACRRYRGDKSAQHALDFDDLEAGACELIRSHPPVRERWRREVEAILVDEFQDTNQRQRDLIHLLAGGPGSSPSAGKLFIVGDAKQSIYGFRGADVTVFRAERERIVDLGPAGGGEGWELATSYRAHRGLVEALNDLLRPVLGQEADPHRPWAEPFAPIEPFRQDPGPGVDPPYVELHLTVGSKGDGALDRAARAVVGRVAEMVESGAQVKDGEGMRPLDYGDVAILCRASSSFSHYEDALDQVGLPYLTVAGRGFYDRPEIRDLLNALRALADPTDDLALVGLLRSPAMALSDGAIYRLVEARNELSAPDDDAGPGDGVDLGDGVDPLWDTLRRGEAELGAPYQRRATQAAVLISELHAMAGRTGVGDLLKAFLDRTNYRAALLKAGEQRAVRNVDKLLGDAHASGLVAVSAFLEYVDGLRDSGAREGEARAVAQGAVQIMSVHQAKGLEFPIVVLGDAAWGGGGNRKEVLVDPALGVLLPLKDQDAEEDELPAIYRLAEMRQADQEAAEADRLLYVAATRAREKLLVSGYLGGIKQDGTPYKLDGWLGKLGGPLGLHDLQVPHDEEGCAVHHRALQIGGTEVDCVIYEPECAPYEPTAPPLDETAVPDTPLPPPLLAPVHLGEAAGLREEPQFVFRVVPRSREAKAPSRVVGELVHEALAAWRLPGFGDDASFGQWMRARARAHGLIDSSQIAHALRRSRRLLLRLQEDEWFEELETADQRLHEVPFSVEREGTVDSGKIDLLYLKDGIWTIVEFKTDRLRNREHFEAVLREKDYADQARRYADAAEELLGRRPRCLLWMLDYGRCTKVYSVPAAGLLQRTYA